MGLFDKLFKNNSEPLPGYPDDAIIAVVDGELLANEEIEDPVFAEGMLGQTRGIRPTGTEVVSPCNGTLEVCFPTGHAFAVRAEDGTGILVHIGIDTVNMQGKGFKTFKKQGDKVKAGEKIVSIDLEKIKAAGYASTTMVIVTEPCEGREYNFREPGTVKKGDSLLK